MNILFYTSYEVSPLKGGTERITATIATELQRRYNVKCFSIYNTSISPEFVRTGFVEAKQVPQNKAFIPFLYDFVRKYKIDIIVNQGAFGLALPMRQVLDKYKDKYLLMVHHFNPGAEEYFHSVHNVVWQLKQGNEVLKNMIKLFAFPILSLKKKRELHKIYHTAYECSDRVILLSEKFQDEFRQYANIKDVKKFRYIPNALSFDTFFDMRDYDNKQKEVLVVSRLDEVQKRISLILRMWKYIESLPSLEDWRLTIVGHGDEYEHVYREYVEKNELKRVHFEGARHPEPYYKRASILPLTSAYEGWGLTLTEAQQYGVIPVAFNSYASLTDIITDGENGYVIPDNDLDLYVKRLVCLMQNYKLRKKLANNAIESSKRFRKEIICLNWINLFNEFKKK